VIWADYIAGKTVAVVGPAPLERDQSADIDSHDIVYRTSQHLDMPPEYGSRLDAVFFNGQLGREIYNDERAEVKKAADRAAWWVFKSGNNTYRIDGPRHVAARPKITNPNAITMMLWDLIQYPVGSITVFGADLYAAGPGHAYHDAYDRRLPWSQGQGIIMHKPWEQMRVHRAVHRTGKVIGDDRYLAAVTMTDAEYQTVIDRWQAAAEEAA
jgi:hypothetical protein